MRSRTAGGLLASLGAAETVHSDLFGSGLRASTFAPVALGVVDDFPARGFEPSLVELELIPMLLCWRLPLAFPFA